MAIQHYVVHIALRWREGAADGPRARDVAGVSMQLAAGVHKQELPCPQHLVIAPVMDGHRIHASSNHGRVLRPTFQVRGLTPSFGWQTASRVLPTAHWVCCLHTTALLHCMKGGAGSLAWERSERHHRAQGAEA